MRETLPLTEPSARGPAVLSVLPSPGAKPPQSCYVPNNCAFGLGALRYGHALQAVEVAEIDPHPDARCV